MEAANTPLDARAPLVLQEGPHRARVAPAAGGRLLDWSTELPEGRVQWLVPITASQWPAHAWPKGGLFPLAPFSNRVRDAQLHWRGRTLLLDPLPGSRHALHGQAQAMVWQTKASRRNQVTLCLEHPAGAGGWPWRWQLEQTIRLTADGLEIDLALQNTDTTDMPAGLGMHPYFSADRVQLSAARRWAHDQELTLGDSEPNTQEEWRRDAGTWTVFLSEWQGSARLTWPDGRQLTLHVRGPLGHVVLHCNAGRYLCVEPATHVCDGFNLAAMGHPGTGLRVLAPGETLAVGLSLSVASNAR